MRDRHAKMMVICWFLLVRQATSSANDRMLRWLVLVKVSLLCPACDKEKKRVFFSSPLAPIGMMQQWIAHKETYSIGSLIM